VRKVYASLRRYPFNLATARAELRRSRHPNGFSATLVYPDSQPLLGKAALSLANNLKQLNVDLTVREIPYSSWVARLAKRDDLRLETAQWFPDYPDPANPLVYLASGKHARPGGLNIANYRNATVDSLLDAQLGTRSDRRRARLIARALTIVVRDAPYLPIWWNKVGAATRREFRYVGLNPFFLTQPWAARNIRAA
jgi:peptide/nickel transport system substrate-binding protein